MNRIRTAGLSIALALLALAGVPATARSAPEPRTGMAAATTIGARILFKSDALIMMDLTIDGEASGSLNPGAVTAFVLGMGQHIVEYKASSGADPKGIFSSMTMTLTINSEQQTVIRLDLWASLERLVQLAYAQDLDVNVTAKELIHLDGDDGLMGNGRIAPGSVLRVDRALVMSPAKVHVTDGKATGWAFSILDLSFSVRLQNGLWYDVSPRSARS